MKLKIRRSQLALITAMTLVAATLGTVGCTHSNENTSAVKTDAGIRPLTTEQAIADYDAMIHAIQSLYGPLEYKEARFGYSFADEAKRIRGELVNAATDQAKMAKYLEVLRLLQDGHVSLSIPVRSRLEIPIFVMPVENKFLVFRVGQDVAPYGIAPGDEILSVDGKTPEDTLNIALKYAWMANADSDKHLSYALFFRSSNMPELAPSSAFAQIEFAKPDGTKKMARIAWKETSPNKRVEAVPKAEDAEVKRERMILPKDAFVSSVLQERLDIVNSMGSIFDMGAAAPWYWSAKLKKKFGVTMLLPERDRVQQFYTEWRKFDGQFDSPATPFEVKKIPAVLPDIFAAMYRYESKTVLMLRMPSYGAEDQHLNMAVYSALVDQFQPIADVLVVDQTHNPGGSVTYTENMAQLIAPNGMNGFVQFLNTDRRWFQSLTTWWTSIDPALAASATGSRLLTLLKGFERDSELGLRLTKDPFSFSMQEVLPAAPGAVWSKPVLVLIDELCGSGGDSFPMLVKANKLGKLFGHRTMGLGGSVEPILDLPFTRAQLRLTRGLFTSFKPDGVYQATDFVENNGVTPDIEYTQTVSDFRAGFEGYFKAFNAEAVKLVP